MPAALKVPACALCATLIATGYASSAVVEAVKEGGSDVAIVMIHGLEGSARTSFTSKTTQLGWMDLISADQRLLQSQRLTSNADIFLVDYSDVFEDPDVEVSIEEMTSQVSDALDASNIMRNYNHVWFVSHSLGGILTKRMLVKWLSVGRDQYLRHTLGVSLLGTPSNGTPLANMGDTDLGRLFAAWLGVNARHVSDLKTTASTNTYLQALENDWANFVQYRNDRLRGLPRISCGYETKNQYSVGFLFSFKVVPSIYASTQCDGERKPFNKTHTELTKPLGESDPVHDWLYTTMRAAFITIRRSREEITDGTTPGALMRKVNLVNSGNKSLGRDGEPLVDEQVNVDEEDVDELRRLKLKEDRYQGGTWADLFDTVAEDNSCIKMEVHDSTRRHILLDVEGAVACPKMEASGSALACHSSAC